MKHKKWANVFLFMYDVKSIGCIYFVAFVIFYLAFGIFDKDMEVTLDFYTAMEIMVASLLIGFGKVLMIQNNNISIPRILIWGTWSLSITIGFSSGFQWFSMYPDWYKIVFYGIITISFLLVWFVLYFSMLKETMILNDALNNYKEKE